MKLHLWKSLGCGLALITVATPALAQTTDKFYAQNSSQIVLEKTPEAALEVFLNSELHGCMDCRVALAEIDESRVDNRQEEPIWYIMSPVYDSVVVVDDGYQVLQTLDAPGGTLVAQVEFKQVAKFTAQAEEPRTYQKLEPSKTVVSYTLKETPAGYVVVNPPLVRVDKTQLIQTEQYATREEQGLSSPFAHRQAEVARQELAFLEKL